MQSKSSNYKKEKIAKGEKKFHALSLLPFFVFCGDLGDICLE
jgi:hypothetical protein